MCLDGLTAWGIANEMSTEAEDVAGSFFVGPNLSDSVWFLDLT